MTLIELINKDLKRLKRARKALIDIESRIDFNKPLYNKALERNKITIDVLESLLKRANKFVKEEKNKEKALAGLYDIFEKPKLAATAILDYHTSWG